MVAIDFSPIGTQLVRYADALARKLEAEVHLVNVINQRDIEALRQAAEATSAFSLPDQLEALRKDRLKGLKTILVDNDIDPKTVGQHVEMGIPYEGLTSAIHLLGIDLLVMGTRGRGQFKGMLFGSTAARMLSKCPVPLLTLREED
jgi:nucleotide-binding universal stress UspA family protein